MRFVWPPHSPCVHVHDPPPLISQASKPSGVDRAAPLCRRRCAPIAESNMAAPNDTNNRALERSKVRVCMYVCVYICVYSSDCPLGRSQPGLIENPSLKHAGGLGSAVGAAERRARLTAARGGWTSSSSSTRSGTRSNRRRRRGQWPRSPSRACCRPNHDSGDASTTVRIVPLVPLPALVHATDPRAGAAAAAAAAASPQPLPGRLRAGPGSCGPWPWPWCCWWRWRRHAAGGRRAEQPRQPPLQRPRQPQPLPLGRQQPQRGCHRGRRRRRQQRQRALAAAATRASTIAACRPSDGVSVLGGRWAGIFGLWPFSIIRTCGGGRGPGGGGAHAHGGAAPGLAAQLSPTGTGRGALVCCFSIDIFIQQRC